MKLYYVTLNTSQEAVEIGRVLLEKRLALCVNWFPITCAYIWKQEIVEEPEVVLIVKTQDGYGQQIQQVINQHISYTNFIAELTPTNVNQGFLDWLNTEIPTSWRSAQESEKN